MSPLRDPNLVWWSSLLLTQTLLIASYLTPSSEGKVTKMITFDQGHNSAMVRPTDNERFPKDTYLRKINKRSTAKNRTQLGLKNETMELSKGIGLQEDKSGDSDEATPFLPPMMSKSKNDTESCSNRCSNLTRFTSSRPEEIPHCHCDSSCNDIFMDCCSDYTRHCRDNVKVETEPV